MRLFEIDKEIENLLVNAVDEDGVLNEEFESVLDALSMEKEQKVLNSAKLLKSWEAEIKAFKEAESNIRAKRVSVENKVKRLKEYVSNYAMGENYKDSEVTVSWRKSESVKVDGVDFPEQYLKTTVTTKNAEIKKALQMGEEFDGAKIVTNYNLQVK